MAATPEQVLRDLGYSSVFEKAAPPFGDYVNALRSGNLVFVVAAPQDVNGVFGEAGKFLPGRFGKDFHDDKNGKLLTELSGVRALQLLRSEIGELSRVRRVVKLDINLLCEPEFKGLTSVANGCSELFVKVFGRDKALAVRETRGAAALPFGMSVETSVIFEVE
ncbi:MAG: RidA family protein [Burkholderiaceae bacterium]